jgi:hypothetical protein
MLADELAISKEHAREGQKHAHHQSGIRGSLLRTRRCPRGNNVDFATWDKPMMPSYGRIC